MAAVTGTVVLLAATVLVPEAATVTLNSRSPDLLPADCGRRLVKLDHVSQPFIVGEGNTTAYNGQFPWQARIQVYKRAARGYVHQCGGIIITQQHVLTAAHCLDHVAQNAIVVRVGDWRSSGRDSAEQEFGVSSVRLHDHFGAGTSFANDIALLRLRMRRGVGIEFSQFVQPACLPEADAKYEWNAECEVSGWGRTADGALISETLRGASVPLVSDAFCSAPEVHEQRFVPGRMFCAGLVRGGPDACGGDSGGPLVCRDRANNRFVAFGIVSSGDPLGCGRLLGLYTKVSGFVGWLLPRLQLDLEEKNTDVQPTSAAPSIQPTGAAPSIQPTSAAPSVQPGTDILNDHGCGKSSSSPPASIGAASTTDAGLFPWLASIFGSTEEIICADTVTSNR